LKTFWEIGHEEILSIFGKVTVIKSLALPVLIQCLTVLSDPPSNAIIKFKRNSLNSYGMDDISFRAFW
jgi:hypothetical protein